MNIGDFDIKKALSYESGNGHFIEETMLEYKGKTYKHCFKFRHTSKKFYLDTVFMVSHYEGNTLVMDLISNKKNDNTLEGEYIKEQMLSLRQKIEFKKI